MIDNIRKLAIISLFYHDEFLDSFVLKGGNALNLIYGFNNRSSTDIDVSIQNDFNSNDIKKIEARLYSAFDSVFGEENLKIFDFKFYPSPTRVVVEYENFWGGYTIEFKCIEKNQYKPNDIDTVRRHAVVVGNNQHRTFKIDISKYEYCDPKVSADLMGYTIYVYTPVMMVYEKLRAIFQQMERYKQFVRTNRRPRARDFFDIHTIINNLPSPDILYTTDNVRILKEIFAIKRVPLYFLELIPDERDFHREDFTSVRDTISGIRIESYDYYFDYVIKMITPLSYLWKDVAEDQIAATKEHLN